MKINKQLFEDVLSGKLKGEFLLRNLNKVKSEKLRKNLSSNKEQPYAFYERGIFFGYKENGCFFSNEMIASNDIIDFIPDTNMKEKELTIKIPKGQEIDWQESAKQEKIVFKNINTKPRSWEEYCNNFSGELFYFSNRNSIESVVISDGMSYTAKDYLPSKELAKAFLAMMQLMSLRQVWIGDWNPNWKDSTRIWCIISREYKLEIGSSYVTAMTLSFPTEEMAKEFMNCFKDLLEIAKPLI